MGLLYDPPANKKSRLYRKSMHGHQPSSESGNALWFILLAIALLVALTITITRSSENSEQNGERDRDRIQASDILRQAKGIAGAIDQMRLNGVAENDISFDNPIVAGYANASCTTGNCLLFGSSGAGMTYKSPLSDWLDQSESAKPGFGDWFFYGTACIPNVGTGDSTCAGTASATDLIVGLPWINESLCIEINRLLGVANLSNPTRPPVIATGAYTPALVKYTGTFTPTSVITSAGGEFDGKQAGCFQGAAANPAGGYHFYQAVLAR
jgi:hypothetical protein